MKKRELYDFLKGKDSPLAAHVDTLYRVSNKYRIDPKLIVAIAGAESSYGQHLSGAFNAWGIGPGRSYKSWDDGLRAAAKLLRENYVGEGLTSLRQIQRKWAPSGASNDPNNMNSVWLRNTSSIYAELGGNANTVAKGFEVDTSPTLKDNKDFTEPEGVTELEPPPVDDPFDVKPGFDYNEPTLMDVGLGRASPTDFLGELGEQASEELAAFEYQQSQPEAEPGSDVTPSPGGSAPGSATFLKPGKLAKPLSTKPSSGSEFNVSDPEGAPSANGGNYHAAKDWMAPGGSAVYSPEAGKIVEVRQSRGNSGQVYGGTVKVQTGDGRVWVFRHVNPLKFREGQKVKPGQRIASVVRWADNPGSSHSHIELWKTLQGGYNYENMIDPMTWFR